MGLPAVMQFRALLCLYNGGYCIFPDFYVSFIKENDEGGEVLVRSSGSGCHPALDDSLQQHLRVFPAASQPKKQPIISSCSSFFDEFCEAGAHF